MKHLLFTFSILTGTLLYGQSFIPIPADSTSQWRISRGYYDGICVNTYNSLYYVGDTMVHSGKVFYKIYESGEFRQLIGHPPGPCNETYNYGDVYRGAIRSENEKTYSLDGNNEEQLLMDFTLDVGDTMYSYISPGLIVESIDSVLVGAEYRKRFNFSNSDVCNWMIEGIGHEAGLFEPMTVLLEFVSEFYCYAENNTPLFGDLDCILNVGAREIPIPDNLVAVYPNPTEGLLRVEMASSGQVIESYRLTDIYGRIIFENIFSKKNNHNFEIDISALPEGVYILQISAEDQGSYISKIIRK
jgi:hypothetical protein